MGWNPIYVSAFEQVAPFHITAQAALSDPDPIAVLANSASLQNWAPSRVRENVFVDVLDIDSPRPGRFTQIESKSLGQYCRKLCELLPAVS